jgi:DNA sulfur modification protein DndB
MLATQTAGRAQATGGEAFEYVFPAIRGIQAEHEFYVTMCPLRLIPKILLYDEDELVPEMRAQRTLNLGRIPELTCYITENRSDYVFSALTASVDGKVRFEPFGESTHSDRVGLLAISMETRFVINDGQHRRAAITEALKKDPTLADESIALVLFYDEGLKRSQQMFADLNRHAVKPSPSLGVLYDHREEDAAIARLIALELEPYKGLVELESTSLSPRSRRLFTLSAIHKATQALLHHQGGSGSTRKQLASSFWLGLAEQFPEWRDVRSGERTAGQVRDDSIHTTSLALNAFAIAGNLLAADGFADAGTEQWEERLRNLGKIDYSRSNRQLWEGRAMVGGKVTKSHQSLALTTNVILEALEIELPPENQKAEAAIAQGKG